jgi:hypothetical protein
LIIAVPYTFKTARYRCKWTYTATAHIIRSVTQTIPPTIFPHRHDWIGRAVGYWNTAPRTPDFVRQEAVPAPGSWPADRSRRDGGFRPPRAYATADHVLSRGAAHADAFCRDTTAVDRRKLGDAARSADTGPVRAQPDGSGATDAQRLRRSNRRILRPGKYGASAGVALYSESSIHLSDLRFSHMRRRGPVRWRRHFWPLTAADCSPSTYGRRPAIRSLSIRRFTVRRWTFAAFAELAGRSIAKPRARAGLSDSTSDTVYTLVVSGG